MLEDSAVVGAMKKLDYTTLLSHSGILKVGIWYAVDVIFFAIGPKRLGGSTKLSRLLRGTLDVGFGDTYSIRAKLGDVRDDDCFFYCCLEVAVDVL